MIRRSNLILLCGFLFGLFLEAADPVPSAPPAKTPELPLSREAEKGPVKLRVSIDRNRVTVADKITFTLEAIYQDRVTVTLPPLTENLGDFLVTQRTRELPRPLGGGATSERLVYTLDSLYAGASSIPPLTVHFKDLRTPESTKENKDFSLESPVLEIVVSPVTDGTQELRDIKDVLSYPSAPLWPWLAGGTGLVLLGGVLFLLARRRRKQAAPPPVPPDIIAFAALERLARSDLLEKEGVRIFYYELTGILRTYLEGRYGLQAPEQTTEEFLASPETASRLNPGQKKLLTSFLTSSDLVKYATHLPGKQEIEGAFSLARDFLLETRQAPASRTDPREVRP